MGGVASPPWQGTVAAFFALPGRSRHAVRGMATAQRTAGQGNGKGVSECRGCGRGLCPFPPTRTRTHTRARIHARTFSHSLSLAHTRMRAHTHTHRAARAPAPTCVGMTSALRRPWPYASQKAWLGGTSCASRTSAGCSPGSRYSRQGEAWVTTLPERSTSTTCGTVRCRGTERYSDTIAAQRRGDANGPYRLPRPCLLGGAVAYRYVVPCAARLLCKRHCSTAPRPATCHAAPCAHAAQSGSGR